MATGVTKDEYSSYFEAARSWDADRARKAEADRRVAWRWALVATASTVAVLALHVLAPVRSVEPYVIRVDQRTGAADIVSVLRDTKTVTADEAVRKYFLSEYVRTRESWVWSAREELFKRGALLSSPDALKKFRADRDPRVNPRAPSLVFTNGETVGVTIRNIAFISSQVAQVRLTKVIERAGSEVERSDWLATIVFQFSDKPESEEARLYNPLGFVVVSYRIDPEFSR